MIKPISDLTHLIYGSIAKPILFKFSADSVHASITKTGFVAQSIPPARWLMRKSWRYDDPFLHTSLLGIDFLNPIGMSAGFDKEGKLAPLLCSIGFGLAECGSVTFRYYKGNQQPWYLRLPKTKSIIVNSGLKSDGVKVFINNLSRLSPALTSSFPINVSVAKTNSKDTTSIEDGINDYCQSLKLLDQHDFHKLYTINISCPNTYGGEPFANPKNLDKLLTAIDNLSLSKPVFVKMPIDESWYDLDQLLKVASKHNVGGITIGNLRKNRQDPTISDKLPASAKGNLSGRPCWEPSNLLLAKAFVKYGDRFKFIGVGGVFSAEDAYTKIKLGASLVEMITGVIFNGPSIVGKINKELVYLAKQDGYKNIAEAIGVDAKRISK